MILVDTSIILAALNDRDHNHVRAAQSLLDATPPLLLSPFIAAEVDYMLCEHAGQKFALQFLEDVAARSYALESFTADDIQQALVILNRFQDLNIGLADASLVVLAQRHDIIDILTLDERHFRALRGPGGRPFRILPVDD